MLDDFSRRSKAVRAALRLAETRGWNATSLIDIAQAASLGLADLRREFTCKSDVLKAFQAEVDAEVLAKTRPAAPEQPARDRLFDIVMTRFEVMAPYKPALKRIAADLRCRPGEAAGLLCSGLASQYWMLAGAGAKLDGASGALRVTGPCGDLRQGVRRLARRRYAGARPHHGRARPETAKGRTHARRHGDGVPRPLPLRMQFRAARLWLAGD